MVTVEDIKTTLGIDSSDVSKDTLIAREIERAKAWLISYTNNQTIFDLQDFFIDDCMDYLVCRRMNVDTSNANSAGKVSESVGTSTAFSNDIPLDMKKGLGRYTKVKFI
jgi:hypothetical protein